MKGKQLAILLVLVLVVGGLSVFLLKGSLSSWSNSSGTAGQKVLKVPANSVNDVATFDIKTKDGDLTLAKKDGIWTVQQRADYPANFEKVGELLLKFWDLKSVQEEKVGPSQMPRLELVEPGKDGKTGTLVDFKDKDGKRITALLVGKKYMKKSDSPMGEAGGMPAGRYVKPPGDGTKVSLVSETFEELESKPETWLKRDFIKVDNVKSVAFAGTAEGQTWKMSRETATGEWKLDDAKPDEKIDGGKVVSFGTLLANASFNDVLAPDAKPEETGLDKPGILTFETFDGFTYVLKIGKANPDTFPVMVTVSANLPKERTPGKDEKPEDKEKLDKEFDANQRKLEAKLKSEKEYEKRAYLMPKSTLDNFVKTRAELLVPKTEPAAAPETGAAPAPPGAPGAPNAPAALRMPPAGAPHPPGVPPVSAVTPPVRATVTTPPVQVPTHPTPPTPPSNPPPALPAATPPAAPPSTPPAPAPPATPPASPAEPASPPSANPPAASPPPAVPPSAQPPAAPSGSSPSTPPSPPSANPAPSAPAPSGESPAPPPAPENK